MNLLMTLPLLAANPAANLIMADNVAGDTLRLGGMIMWLVYHILDFFGLAHDSAFTSWIYVAVVFALSFAIGYVVKLITIKIVDLIAQRYKNDVLDNLVRWRFFTKVSRVIPPIFFLIFMQLTLNTMHKAAVWLERITGIYISIVFAIALIGLIDAIWTHINTRQNQRRLPLNGLVQLLKVVIWGLVIITDIAIILDKSPLSLLAGLGAFAAVLMLIFKDSILGVVAGVQLSENDSLHVGDWIKVNGTDANGTVSEVSLTAVKVVNWDMTTTSLPPYSLVSGSFTNYRSMQESNTRRIMRSWMVDADSIVPLDDVIKSEISKLPFMADYFTSNADDPSHPQETNLGAFRAYLEMYLAANKYISSDSTHFVTTLDQTNGGVPLQLYCFTSTSAWIDYEHIQAMVFEHVAVMMAKFRLYTFENESGRDTIVDGYMSNGRIPDGILGIPYPFYLGATSPDNPGAQPKATEPAK
ncbi:MAG: mechanosensitive ion channel family protein [Clostridium sp.]|nr:mechanosensitive ion channel family protein [Clostridium sp.]